MKRIFAIVCVSLLLGGCRCNKDAAGTSARPAASLDGNWELEYVAGTALPFDALYPGTKPNASLDTTEKTIAGRNGCNNYSGNFILEGSRFSTDPSSMISTKMFCEGDGEKTFMGALGKVDAYAITGDRLELKSGGDVVMRFHRK